MQLRVLQKLYMCSGLSLIKGMKLVLSDSD